MANLRTAMDSSFWDFNVSSSQSLFGVSRHIPCQPVPADNAKPSKVTRVVQLSVLERGFPLGIMPALSPSANHKELGSFALQSLLWRVAVGEWWVGLIGQFRPKKLISSIKAEISAAEEWELPLIKDVGKHFVEKSLYAFGLCTNIPLTSSSSLLLSTEKHGERNKRSTKATLFHKLPDHDLTLEASWPELFVDNKGKYWEVPESVSLDCSSLVSDSGLRYRFGIHKSGGQPHLFGSTNDEEATPPLSLLSGVCAKAAVSYEKSKDLWRQEETKEDLIIETDKGRFVHPAYDVRLKEPHSTVSGIIGGIFETWLGGLKGSSLADSSQDSNSSSNSRGRFGADLFGSACYTYQHGKFRKSTNDLTRIDARLDIASASALVKKVSTLFRSNNNQSPDLLASPRLNVIVQQQIAGPLVFRIDSKFSLLGSSDKYGPRLEDVIYSLNYSLRLLQSGKVVAWYSPKRKEGMVELRLFEF